MSLMLVLACQSQPTVGVVPQPADTPSPAPSPTPDTDDDDTSEATPSPPPCAEWPGLDYLSFLHDRSPRDCRSRQETSSVAIAPGLALSAPAGQAENEWSPLVLSSAVDDAPRVYLGQRSFLAEATGRTQYRWSPGTGELTAPISLNGTQYRGGSMGHAAASGDILVTDVSPGPTRLMGWSGADDSTWEQTWDGEWSLFLSCVSSLTPTFHS